jgi:hypothetical protein
MNTVILNWPRSLWEGDYGVVKKIGRNEPIGVEIHVCMETTQEISLYSYLSQSSKTPCFSYYHLCFFLYEIREQRAEQVLPRGEGAWWGGPNNIYTCK